MTIRRSRTEPAPVVPVKAGETPTVEVRVWLHGELVHRELCESTAIASDVVAKWSETEGIECEVVDLSNHPSEEAVEIAPQEEQA